MPSLVFPVYPCTTTAKASFLVNGKAVLVLVHGWLWNDSYAEALVLASDGKSLVLANAQAGFQKLQDS